MVVHDLQHTLDNPFHMYRLDNILQQAASYILNMCYTDALMVMLIMTTMLKIRASKTLNTEATTVYTTAMCIYSTAEQTSLAQEPLKP